MRLALISRRRCEYATRENRYVDDRGGVLDDGGSCRSRARPRASADAAGDDVRFTDDQGHDDTRDITGEHGRNTGDDDHVFRIGCAVYAWHMARIDDGYTSGFDIDGFYNRVGTGTAYNAASRGLAPRRRAS